MVKIRGPEGPVSRSFAELTAREGDLCDPERSIRSSAGTSNDIGPSEAISEEIRKDLAFYDDHEGSASLPSAVTTWDNGRSTVLDSHPIQTKPYVQVRSAAHLMATHGNGVWIKYYDVTEADLEFGSAGKTRLLEQIHSVRGNRWIVKDSGAEAHLLSLLNEAFWGPILDTRHWSLLRAISRWLARLILALQGFWSHPPENTKLLGNREAPCLTKGIRNVSGLASTDPQCTCDWIDSQNGPLAQVITNIVTHIQTCIVAFARRNGLQNYKAEARQSYVAKYAAQVAVRGRKRRQSLPESYMDSTGPLAEGSFLSFDLSNRHDEQHSTENSPTQASSGSMDTHLERVVSPSCQASELQSSEHLKWKIGSGHPKANATEMALRRIRILSSKILEPEQRKRWTSEVDRLESDMLPVLDAVMHNPLKRRVLRWLLHLQFAMEVYGTGKGGESLPERCQDITTLKEKDVKCSCRWPLDGTFAERTWKHFRNCLCRYIKNNKGELQRSTAQVSRKETGRNRKKVDM